MPWDPKEPTPSSRPVRVATSLVRLRALHGLFAPGGTTFLAWTLTRIGATYIARLDGAYSWDPKAKGPLRTTSLRSIFPYSACVRFMVRTSFRKISRMRRLRVQIAANWGLLARSWTTIDPIGMARRKATRYGTPGPHRPSRVCSSFPGSAQNQEIAKLCCTSRCPSAHHKTGTTRDGLQRGQLASPCPPLDPLSMEIHQPRCAFQDKCRSAAPNGPTLLKRQARALWPRCSLRHNVCERAPKLFPERWSHLGKTPRGAWRNLTEFGPHSAGFGHIFGPSRPALRGVCAALALRNATGESRPCA